MSCGEEESDEEGVFLEEEVEEEPQQVSQGACPAHPSRGIVHGWEEEENLPDITEEEQEEMATASEYNFVQMASFMLSSLLRDPLSSCLQVTSVVFAGIIEWFVEKVEGGSVCTQVTRVERIVGEAPRDEPKKTSDRMESAAQGEVRSCSICWNLYTKPVSLMCGHRFCLNCIVSLLDKQEGVGGVYSCPDCRREYSARPTLENVLPGQQEETEILCMFCTHYPVPAVKMCLYCETSMCERHLQAHNKKVDHMVVEPSEYLCSKKHSTYKTFKVDVCEGAPCSLVGKRKGLIMCVLEEVRLVRSFQNLSLGEGTVEEKIQIMQGYKEKLQEQADDEKKRIRTLFHDLGRCMEIEEGKVRGEISRQEEQILLSISDQIQQLEAQKDEESKEVATGSPVKMAAGSPVKMAAGSPSRMATLSPGRIATIINELRLEQSARDCQDMEVISATDLDDFLILTVLNTSLTDLLLKLKSRTNYPVQKVNELFLQAKSAHNLVALSHDLKTASSATTGQNRRDVKERFSRYQQVLSLEEFSTGRHYWEVEVSESGYVDVGVCYESIERKGENSSFEESEKSWCIGVCDTEYFILHGSQEHYAQPLHCRKDCRILGIYLDYDAGHLAFYQLGELRKCLHVFSTTFTEPLRAAFGVHGRAWVRIVH
ncbi:E3 ubiquitin-protein ligase TRIM21-like [Hyperolius riggenbachi]|uniref:E3 ubiquitin-protein ligase TRIM21-like n=1 Tax=Hyperolius riggenbachi TaxID=752182 RepID=UPI0035A3C2BE